MYCSFAPQIALLIRVSYSCQFAFLIRVNSRFLFVLISVSYSRSLASLIVLIRVTRSEDKALPLDPESPIRQSNQSEIRSPIATSAYGLHSINKRKFLSRCC